MQVSVRTNTDISADCCLFGGHGRIEIKDTIGTGIRGQRVEIILRKVQCKRKDLYEFSREL